ncbi:MAG TPA: hypothetical protein VGR78_06200 [Verrucomicrobiae bacterium]|nr:hypothetical protein [Verrucomicrobiae bacterium]
MGRGALFLAQTRFFGFFALTLLAIFSRSAAESNPVNQNTANTAQTENAALLYYRAMWAEPFPWKKRDALESGTVDEETRLYFQIHKDALGLIHAAGKMNACDWGIDAINESPFGLLGVLSRAKGIPCDLPLDHFRYLCAVATNNVPADEILTTFDLARHLERQTPLAITTLTRGVIVAKSVIAAAKHMGKFDPAGLKQLEDYIGSNRAVFTFRVGDALLAEVALVRQQIEEFQRENPRVEGGEKLAGFLRQSVFNPKDPAFERKNPGQIFELINQELDWQTTIASDFDTADLNDFQDKMKSLAEAFEKHSASAPWIQSYKSMWERLFQGSQKLSLSLSNGNRACAQRDFRHAGNPRRTAARSRIPATAEWIHPSAAEGGRSQSHGRINLRRIPI